MNLITKIEQGSIIIADATTLINLYATGKIEEILSFLPNPVYVAKYVVENEVLSIKSDSGAYETIDIQGTVRSGLLHVVDVQSDGNLIEEYINFSGLRIDAGEAMCFAFAKYNNCIVATDDLRAVRVIEREGYNFPILTTARILHESMIEQKLSQEEVSLAIHNIEKYANYYGAKQDLLYQWWKELSDINR